MKSIRSRLSASLALVAATFIGMTLVFASDSYTALLNTPVSITGPDSVCKKVRNASATGLSEYIPTTSVAEWQSFVAHPPAGVTLGSCAATWVTNAHCSGNMLGNPRAYDSGSGQYVGPTDAAACVSACNQYTNACCELDTYTNTYYPWASPNPTTAVCLLYEGSGVAGGTSVNAIPMFGLQVPLSSQAAATVSTTQAKTCDPLNGPAAQASYMTGFYYLGLYQESGTPVVGSSYMTTSMLNKCQRACGLGGTTFCTATEYPAFGPFSFSCNFTVPGTLAQPSLYNPYVASCR